MMSCLEKRWNDCDKVPYIVSYVLDPRLGNDGLRLESFGLAKMIEGVYQRLFQTEASTLLLEYARYTGLKNERQKFSSTPLLFWTFAGDSMKELSKLGTCLISLSPQGAALERVFSASGIFHNALRNRLSHEKAEKMVRVKMDLLQRNPRRQRRSPNSKLPIMDVDGVQAIDPEADDEQGTSTESEESSDEVAEETLDLDSDEEEAAEASQDTVNAECRPQHLTLTALFDINFDYDTLFMRFDCRKLE